jgi:hypothetical protein
VNSFWADCRYAQWSDSGGAESFQSMTFTFLYGLHARACFGVSLAHYTHDRGFGPNGRPINKQGPGDTRIFLKWRAQPKKHAPLGVGLRPSLRLPTGYDREGDELLAFTTRSVDFELLGLIAYETPRMGVYLNPGISLPGGKWHNELLAGVGFDLREGLPLGFSLRGEYFMRFDIPDEQFQHEIFAAIEHTIPYGLSVEAGFSKRLLHGEEIGPEISLRLGKARGGVVPLIMKPPPMARPTRILVPRVQSLPPDPRGMAAALRQAMVRELSWWHGISARTQGDADYTASLEIVSVNEATGRGFSIPKLLSTPRATLKIAARVTLIGPQGERVIDGKPLNLDLKRGMGVKLLPPGGNEDTWVPTAQVRQVLLDKGLRCLAEKAAAMVAHVVPVGDGGTVQ